MKEEKMKKKKILVASYLRSATMWEESASNIEVQEDQIKQFLKDNPKYTPYKKYY